MNDLKADAVLSLVGDGSLSRNRDAAKLLSKCRIEARPVSVDAAGPAGRTAMIDVLVHGEHEVISCIKADDTAGRLENALRRSSNVPVRFMQWVEEGVSTGPGRGAGIGDGQTPAQATGKVPTEREQMHRDPSRARVPHGSEPRAGG